jgi:hypothetical protein
MSLAVQREWPVDAWKREHTADSWRYDFGPNDLSEFVALPSFCGPQRAPTRFRERLARHYDDLAMAPSVRERAASELPFEPSMCPVKLVQSHASIERGLAVTQGREPFVVPNCTEFDIDIPRLDAALRAEKQALIGHRPDSGLRFLPVEITGAEALARLRAGTLDINIFDCPATLPLSTLPSALRRPNPKDAERFPFQVGHLVSPAGYETLFHSDGYGHTYNVLLSGEKYWWFVEPHGATQEWLQGKSITEIVTSDNFARWGRVYVLHQRAGEAVVFPGYWPHRVFTYEASLGLAGYVHLDEGT